LSLDVVFLDEEILDYLDLVWVDLETLLLGYLGLVTRTPLVEVIFLVVFLFLGVFFFSKWLTIDWMDLGLLVWNSLHAIPLEIKYRASFESFRILGIFFLSLDVVFRRLLV
jgi:hypothetical protein